MGPQRPPGKRWRRSRRLRWGAGIAAVLLAAGGTVTGLALSSSTPANAAEAVALNAALNAPGHCTAPAGGGAPAANARGASAGQGKCLRLRLRQVKGMYGELAFHTANGTQTLAFERGAITSASGNTLTVRAADGAQWNWNLTSGSVIRKTGTRIPAGQLTSGTRVFIGGVVAGGRRDARLVFLRMAKKAGSRSQWPSGPGSSGSSASGSSGSSAPGSSGSSTWGAGS